MTAQEIFDTVWHAMKAQGRQSLDKHGDCMYRGEGGAKCAVGCLISDDEYTPEMDAPESTATSVISLHRTELLPARLSVHLDLLDELQNAHDRAYGDFWPKFSERARRIAEWHNLTIPENNQ